MLPPWGSGCDWQEPGATHGPELGRRARSLAQGGGDKQHLRPQDSTMEHRDRKQTEKMGRLSSINTITHTPKYYTDVEIHFGLSSRLWSWLHVKGKNWVQTQVPKFKFGLLILLLRTWLQKSGLNPINVTCKHDEIVTLISLSDGRWSKK